MRSFSSYFCSPSSRDSYRCHCWSYPETVSSVFHQHHSPCLWRIDECSWNEFFGCLSSELWINSCNLFYNKLVDLNLLVRHLLNRNHLGRHARVLLLLILTGTIPSRRKPQPDATDQRRSMTISTSSESPTVSVPSAIASLGRSRPIKVANSVTCKFGDRI